jgi:hypothetical protein
VEGHLGRKEQKELLGRAEVGVHLERKEQEELQGKVEVGGLMGSLAQEGPLGK